MEKHEQRFVVKFYFLKGFGCKKIHRKLGDTLGDSAMSITSVKRWLDRFKNGDFSCQDLERSGRPENDLSESIIVILTEMPFATAKFLAKRLCCSPNTIKKILIENLGYKKYIRRWVPHELTWQNKCDRVQKSEALLNILLEHKKTNFAHIITLDESWFYFRYQAKAMFAPSPEKVPPRISNKISSKKCMITIAFSGNRLYCLDGLPKGTKFNQDYFIENILSTIVENIKNSKNRTSIKLFEIHMDNCKIHNGSKSKTFLQIKKLNRVPHPAYSPDISPCDFWLFGKCKNLLEEKEISSQDELINEIDQLFDDITFEELQSVFDEWIERLKLVIMNNGEYINK